MKIRYYNGKILKRQGNQNYEAVEEELWTQGGLISYCGDGTGAEKEQFDREIDLHGNLLIPGFKNAHTHSGMTFLRSYADDLPLDEWLHKQVFPMEAKLTGEHIYWLTRLAILEYLTSGITMAFDMYFEPADVAKAATDSGFRMVMCGAVNGFKESAEKLANYYETYNHYHELVSYRLGCHAEYTTQEELLKEIAQLVEHYKAPFYTHNAETKKEVEGCVMRHKTTPTVYLASLGLYEYGGGGFHMVHVNDEDIAVMKEKKLGVVTNPASNLKLASGIAPIERYLKEGIPVAIGTDGPASNNCLDMFREMYLTTVLQKLLLEDAAAVPADEVLNMAFAHGARFCGLNDADELAVGKKADMAVIDLNQPNMQPVNHIGKNLVYSGSKQNVVMTIINGKICYDHGTFFVGEEPELIYRKANEIIREFTGR